MLFGHIPLVFWSSGFPFLGSLHWPAGGLDLGVGGVCFLLVLYELWAGERLSLEKASPCYLRPGRPLSVSAVPFGPGIDIWRSCRFLRALMRSLCLLPGGLGGVLPCSIGANHCRLRHIGWEKCGHGLTSRPRESSSELFLNELLSLSFVILLGLGVHCLLLLYPFGTVLLVLLARPPLGGCQLLVVLLIWLLLMMVMEVRFLLVVFARRFAGFVVLVRDGKIRLNRKTLAHLAGLEIQSRPRVWQRSHPVLNVGVSLPDRKRRRCDQDDQENVPAQVRNGVG